MRKSNAVYKAQSRERLGGGRREFPMRPSTLEALQRNCDRSGFTDWREFLTFVIHNLDRAGDDTLEGLTRSLLGD